MDASIADCPSENLLTELIEGRLSAAERAAVHRHLDGCTACRALLSDLAKAEIDESGATGRLEEQATTPGPTPALARATSDPSGGQRFQLLRRLGQGGMGVVYEALDRVRGRRVACKTLRSMSPEALLRFKNEFRSLQDVQHENLVTLGELVEEAGEWWFTMELVEGVDFLTYARDDQRLRAALAQLVSGLHALHCAHKVHRDIKPQNVLVTAAGRVVILDFGLVGDADETDSAIVGTAAYMSPEQAGGASIEPAADWWSVGVMLYEALTGQRPFAPTDRARRAFVPPHQHRPGIPSDLDALCIDLLRPEPTQRPQGAALVSLLHAAAQRTLDAAPMPTDIGRIEKTASSAFVGRQPELQRLREVYARSRDGHPSLVLIVGESGVGKSALLHEFVARAQAEAASAVVLSGRCYERESVPYKAFDGIVDALSRYLKRLPKSEAAALLPRRAAVLVQAFPVLGRVEAMLEAPAAQAEVSDPAEQRSRVFVALRELLARLGERRPLILTIDDLQWADADSIAMLAQLLSPPDAPSLLLLATARPLSSVRPVGWDAAVQRMTEVCELPLGPLPNADARALAERLLAKTTQAAGRDAGPNLTGLAESLALESGGHPLFIDALIQHAESRGPDATSVLRLDDALAASIDRMDAGTRRLLALVAVAGRPIGQKTLTAAAQLDSDEYGRIERRLRTAHMLRGLPGSDRADSGVKDIDLVETYHDRVRETMLARTPAGELASCHQRLAVALEASGKAEPDALARHFHGAGDTQKAAHYTLRAAERAAQTLAFAHAARLYEEAIAYSALAADERQSAQVRLGEMLTAAGQPRAAARAFLVAADGAEDLARLAHRQRAAELLMQNGAFVEGQPLLAEVLRDFDLSFSVTGWGAVLRFLWLRLRLLLRGLRFVERAEKDLQPRELLRVDACWAAAVGHLLFEPLQAMALHSQHLLLALELGEPMRVARALAIEALLRNFLGPRQYRRADELITESRRLAQTLQRPYLRGITTMAIAMIHFHRGHMKTSVELAQEGQAILRAQCPEAAWERRSLEGIIALNLGMMGRYSELSAILPGILQEARERGDHGAENSAQIWLLVLHLAHDEVDRARTLLIEMEDLVQRNGSMMYQGNVLAATAMLSFYTEPEQALRRFFAEWRPVSRRSRTASTEATRCWELYIEAMARMYANDPGLSLGRTRRIAARLQKARDAQFVAQSLGLRAALAYRLGNTAEAARLAALSEQSFKAADYGAYAAAARYRQAQYLGSEAGRALRESALAAMSAQGIKNPERFIRTLLP